MPPGTSFTMMTSRPGWLRKAIAQLNLTPLSGTIVGDNPQGSTNLDIAISSDGKFVYTPNSGSGDIGIFEIEPDGTLNNLGIAGQFAKSEGFNGIAAL